MSLPKEVNLTIIDCIASVLTENSIEIAVKLSDLRDAVNKCDFETYKSCTRNRIKSIQEALTEHAARCTRLSEELGTLGK